MRVLFFSCTKVWLWWTRSYTRLKRQKTLGFQNCAARFIGLLTRTGYKSMKNNFASYPEFAYTTRQYTLFRQVGTYKDLEEHLKVEDCEHFTGNHKKNFVDPDKTGAYTQTVEGMWRHMKAYLPDYGIPPTYLDSYLGAFIRMWYKKQSCLDRFILHSIHPLSCNLREWS